MFVIAFFTAYFTEDDPLTVHVWAGYVVGATVIVRLVWGFVGTTHARFRDFLYGPLTALRYLGQLLLEHDPSAGLGSEAFITGSSDSDST